MGCVKQWSGEKASRDHADWHMKSGGKRLFSLRVGRMVQMPELVKAHSSRPFGENVSALGYLMVTAIEYTCSVLTLSTILHSFIEGGRVRQVGSSSMNSKLAYVDIALGQFNPW
jgi:hypothetical protein